MEKRIYKYDNTKALLIFLVVIGHMTTDYVSDSHMVRWITLWIYTFHMPAFIFLSGLVHKRYDESAALRSDKVLGFFLCGYGLKIFLQFARTLMGQSPGWHWIAEPGIPWYLFVMAEYELLFYILRRIDTRVKPSVLIAAAFALSAVIGYFPAVGDVLCLSRMINFLPIYALGYYLDMRKFLSFIEGGGRRAVYMRIISAAVIIASLAICCFGKWGIYSWRKWFTGRRSYSFLSDYFSYAVHSGWWIRLLVWGSALLITLALLVLIPDRDLGFISKMGGRTLRVYFWHRPVCYLFRNLAVLPCLHTAFGGTYDPSLYGQVPGLAFSGGTLPMLAALTAYVAIGALMTAFFSLDIFSHPADDLMKLARRITSGRS